MAVLDRRKLVMASAAALVATPRPAHAQRSGRGGFAQQRLAQIPGVLQRYIDAGTAAGFVTLIYRHGQIAQVNAVGLADREAQTPMRRDTIFRLASMTKPITCVAALTLMEQGRIGLNEPVDRWLPELANARVLNDPNGPLDHTHPAPRSITLADLLTHSSGVAGMSATGALAQAMTGLRADNPNADEWLRRLVALPLAYDPGSHFNYGTSHDVLGVLIERISGRPFRDYLQTAIFDPLGMRETNFWLPPEKQARLAALYRREPADGPLTPVSRPVPTAPQNFDYGAGGLVSTADDYLQFAKMLLNDGRAGDTRILTRPTVRLMTTNWLTPEQRAAGFVGDPTFWASQGFGLGVSVTDDISRLGYNPYSSPGAFGWPGATGVWWRADPTEDMVTIFMIQSANPASTVGPGDLRTPPSVAFANMAYSAIES
jgi:CubicO group peptidase (beta-lactamase class C family)